MCLRALLRVKETQTDATLRCVSPDKIVQQLLEKRGN